MTPTQKKRLLWTAIIGLLWLRFCVATTSVWRGTGLLGLGTSIAVGFWQGWQQPGMGFAAIVWCILTALSFTFSSIPVYTSKPSLELFTIDQIPTIGCIPSTPTATIDIDTTPRPLASLCNRKPLPIIVGQRIQIPANTPVVIWLGNGESFFTPGDSAFTTQRTGTGYTVRIIQGTWAIYPTQITTPLHALQSQINETYKRDRKEYLQNNFSWVRENAPGLTRVALWKMRLLWLIDRSYRDSADNLLRYMNEIK